ncbi:hypothetical protein ACIQWV_03975 [Streptomyces sp. NPDC098085]|uniref:hypothetical protein n=1 Tax=Streptomyces sp. NPDC098085 TaxID=3366094 RepID=UPI00381B27A5
MSVGASGTRGDTGGTGEGPLAGTDRPQHPVGLQTRGKLGREGTLARRQLITSACPALPPEAVATLSSQDSRMRNWRLRPVKAIGIHEVGAVQSLNRSYFAARR